MSTLTKRTQRRAEGLIGQFIVTLNSPWRVYRVIEHFNSGFRLRVEEVGTKSESKVIRTRKVREATPEEISAAVIRRVTGQPVES